MGQGPSPARARPGALGFWRALGPTLGEGLKPGPGPSPWSKARGLKGLLKYDFPLKNWHYFGKFLSKNIKSQMQIIFLLHFQYPLYLCLFSSIFSLCINVNLPEFCVKLIFFRINWLNAEPGKPARPGPWPCLEGRAQARARPEPDIQSSSPARARLFRARPITTVHDEGVPCRYLNI